MEGNTSLFRNKVLFSIISKRKILFKILCHSPVASHSRCFGYAQSNLVLTWFKFRCLICLYSVGFVFCLSLLSIISIIFFASMKSSTSAKELRIWFLLLLFSSSFENVRQTAVKYDDLLYIVSWPRIYKFCQAMNHLSRLISPPTNERTRFSAVLKQQAKTEASIFLVLHLKQLARRTNLPHRDFHAIYPWVTNCWFLG